MIGHSVIQSGGSVAADGQRRRRSDELGLWSVWRSERRRGGRRDMDGCHCFPMRIPGTRRGLAEGANIRRSAHRAASARPLSSRRSKTSHRLFPIWPVTNVISTDV